MQATSLELGGDLSQLQPPTEPHPVVDRKHWLYASESPCIASMQDPSAAAASEWLTPGTEVYADVAACSGSCPEQHTESDVQNEAFETSATLVLSDSTTTGTTDSNGKKEAATVLVCEEPSRLIKRRAAKRDSARRVRAKKQELLNNLSCEMDEFAASNSTLVADLNEEDGSVAELTAQLSSTRTRTLHTRTLSEQLKQEMQMLRRMAAGLNYQKQNIAGNPQPAVSFSR